MAIGLNRVVWTRACWEEIGMRKWMGSPEADPPSDWIREIRKKV